ncbi:hypothetical protein ACFFWD_30775 [Bradyrhizobium erythrophlei]|uniref:hypothetical protein n=1 Tax=Bradyrhizobium erythrophlei TaxID=1437360 RepID=UPI0035ED933F
MNQGDPTDNALAAIASILDQTTSPPEAAKASDKASDKPAEKAPDKSPDSVEEVLVVLPPPLPPPDEPELIEPEPIQPAPPPIQPIEANGYSKAGPGPMAALRFRWTVREDNGRYFVDETVGEASPSLVNGPFDSDEAIKFVDEREAEARQRFEHFKQEMLGRAAAADLARKDNSEA